MSDYGLKISKSGLEVETANLKDQVMNSEHNSLKVWMTGKVAISVSAWDGLGGGGTGTATVAHHLGYAPFYLTYYTLSNSSKRWLQDSIDDDLLFNIFVTPYSYSDGVSLKMNIVTSGDPKAAWTAYCHYIILIDKAYE